jgi:hypothetical protein
VDAVMKTPTTVTKISAAIKHQDAVKIAARVCTGVSFVGKDIFQGISTDSLK